jgi:hypothetical protein
MIKPIANSKLPSKFEVLTAVSMQVRVGLKVTPCSLVDINISEENAASILRVERRLRTTVSLVPSFASDLLLLLIMV